MKKIYCLLFIVIQAHYLYSSNVLEFSDLSSDGLSVLEHVYYFEDKSNNINFDSIRNVDLDKFKRLDPLQNLYNRDSYWWLRFEIEYTGQEALSAMLLHKKFSNAMLYYTNKGKWKPIDISAYSKNKNVFPFADFHEVIFEPNETQIFYIHSKTNIHWDKRNPDFRLKIFTKEDAWRNLYWKLDNDVGVLFWRVAGLAIIAFLCLFALLQFIQNRDKSYLWYSIYHATILFAYLWRYGRFFQTPFTEWIPTYYKYFEMGTLYLNIIAYSFFLITFQNFNVKAQHRFAEYLKKAIFVLLLLLGIDLCLKILGYNQLSWEIHKVGRFTMVILFGFILWSAYRIKFTAFHFIIAGGISLLIFGLLTYVKDGLAFITTNDIVIQNSFWSLPISPMFLGFIVEALFFALALGVKTNELTKERNKARDIVLLTKDENEQLKQKLENQQSDAIQVKGAIEKLSLPVRDGYELLVTDQILYCAADGNMCRIYLKNGKSLMVSKTLGKIYEKLPSDKFYRIHSSHAVNLDYIIRYKKGEGGHVVLINEIELKVSRANKEGLLRKLQLA